jgi:predicted PP-loop superfamily ATPase
MEPISICDPNILYILTQLKNRLHELGRVAIAYSGGVDSTYLHKMKGDAFYFRAYYPRTSPRRLAD